MANDINYLDLLILKKLEPDSTVEKFGPIINTSFFETANILGSMKIKGLIDIQASIGGLSPIIVLPKAKDIISLAISKASEPLDPLDYEILKNIKRGTKELIALEKRINLASFDLALRLYKLKSNGYIVDQVQSAKVFFSLTEKGFLLAKEKEFQGEQKDNTTQTFPSFSEKQRDIDQELKDLILDEPKPTINENISQKNNQEVKKPKKLPWEVEEKPIKLDKTKMFLSKLEYYIQHYLVIGLVSALIILLVLIALIIILLK
jgi:predicted transcriptional regulator